MLVKEYLILLLNGGLGVQDLGEVKRYPDMNVS